MAEVLGGVRKLHTFDADLETRDWTHDNQRVAARSQFDLVNPRTSLHSGAKGLFCLIVNADDLLSSGKDRSIEF